MYAQFSNPGLIPFWRSVSYSPFFPSSLGLELVETHDVSMPTGAREVTIVTKEPIAHLGRHFEIEDFPLASHSAPQTPLARQ